MFATFLIAFAVVARGPVGNIRETTFPCGGRARPDLTRTALRRVGHGDSRVVVAKIQTPAQTLALPSRDDRDRVETSDGVGSGVEIGQGDRPVSW